MTTFALINIALELAAVAFVAYRVGPAGARRGVPAIGLLEVRRAPAPAGRPRS